MTREIFTQRLILREVTDADHQFIMDMHLNPLITEYLYGDWSEEYVRGWLHMMQQRAKESLQIWLVEEKQLHTPIGFIGADSPPWQAFFCPCIEIGWRFIPESWGHGYAVEAAQAVIDYLFKEQRMPKVVAFASEGNKKSFKVMEKLGMMKEEQSFLNPDIPAEHPLARCLVYTLYNKELDNPAKN